MRIKVTTCVDKFQWINDNNHDFDHYFWIVSVETTPGLFIENLLVHSPINRCIDGVVCDYIRQGGKYGYLFKLQYDEFPDTHFATAQNVGGYCFEYLPHDEFYEKLQSYKKFRQGHRNCWPEREEIACSNCSTQTCMVELGPCRHYRFDGEIDE